MCRVLHPNIPQRVPCSPMKVKAPSVQSYEVQKKLSGPGPQAILPLRAVRGVIPAAARRSRPQAKKRASEVREPREVRGAQDGHRGAEQGLVLGVVGEPDAGEVNKSAAVSFMYLRAQTEVERPIGAFQIHEARIERHSDLHSDLLSG
ncbi:hypothetical protein Vretimale_7959 [Volvox reticuliferus]|uniref:Uncharacterized protein n=1 Tax=Volvox reticuliferus TaxID=1737510 RepID=A0A8J4GA15_9CHLO|nr:hypothetical protein Vretifemale_5190 [Volvox reticuliferus]GIM03269.1 hypothetical protein Vretimale_7959 [Volvox reticuliferus]